jgi:hypothetical protein
MGANLRNIDKFLRWDNAQQMYFPNYFRKEILPKWLGFDSADLQAPNGLLPIAGGGANTPRVGFKQPYASVEGLDGNLGTPFEVRSIVFADSIDGTAVADFTVRLEEMGEVRQLMNRDVHIRTFAGVAQTPALLREPYMFLSQHNISAQFNKTSAGATNCRMFLCGAEYFPWSPEFIRRKRASEQLRSLIGKWMERRKYVTPFWLTTETPIDLAPNATGEFYLKIGDDGHFEGFTLARVSTGDFSWELSEPKTQQTIMNGTCTVANGLGDANFPTILPSAYLVPAGYRLRLQVTDLSGTNNEIFFTIAGRKIYAPFKQVGEVLAQTAIKPSAVPTPADTPAQIVPAPLI